MKIIDEILDNSVDEFIRTQGKYANDLHVTIENNPLTGPEISVRDNGRGIPIEKLDEGWRPELAWSRARAGTNFDDDGRVTMGMNGVGSFCTNVFSTSFMGETCDGKNYLSYTSLNNAAESSVNVRPSKKETFTKVTFNPDMSRFEVDEITPTMISLMEDRLNHLAVSFPGITFTLNGTKIKFKNMKQVADQYSEHSIITSNESIDMILAPGSDEEFRFVSYVNGLNVKNGGNHIDYIVSEVSRYLRPMIKRKYKIEVLPNQIKQHMLLVVYIRDLPNPVFTSQTKERLSNSNADLAKHLNLDFDKLAKKIMATPEVLDPMIQAILFKKEQAERLAAARAQKKQRGQNILNHIKAQSNNPEEKILFICEGQSAIGQLLNVRNPKTTGGYPLKGKILNVTGMSALDIVKSNEINELLAILNLTIGKPATDISYGRIAILTDADVDGGQIGCLLANLFALWPELFEEGRIHKVETPLVIASKGKQKKIFYTL